MKQLAVLGSTGSIGSSVLAVIAAFPDEFEVSALAAGHNVDLLRQQVMAFRPEVVSVARAEDARVLAAAFPDITWVSGNDGLFEVASRGPSDMVVVALTGSAGLEPTLGAIRAGKDIALANKESLVVAGELIMEETAKAGVRLLPVDSEHSAIHQAMRVGPPETVSRLILTASGGPFRTWSIERMAHATVSDALDHPTWKMGRKISVDSATMMNKGLEIIEAHHLFDIDEERIQVLIHPQSLIHSIVEYVDGSLIAQIAVNDMQVPILHALSHPKRFPCPAAPLDLTTAPPLTFEAPDEVKFPALALARDVLRTGGELPAVLNAANEVAVGAFLEGCCPFPAIISSVSAVVDSWSRRNRPIASIEQALATDQEARQLTAEHMRKYLCAAIGSEN